MMDDGTFVKKRMPIGETSAAMDLDQFLLETEMIPSDSPIRKVTS